MPETAQTFINQQIGMAKELIYHNEIIRAEQICYQLYPQAPNNIDLLKCMAMIAGNSNNLEHCKNIRMKIVQLNPEDASAHHSLGVILQRIGMVDPAIQHLIIALRLGMDEKQVFPYLFLLYFEKGDHEKAHEFYIKCPTIYSHKTPLHEHILIVKMIQAREYCKNSRQYYQVIDPEHEIQIHIEKYGLIQYTVTESFLTCLENIIVIPVNFTIIAEEKFLLYEGFDTNSRESILLINSFQHKTNDGRVLVDLPNQKRVIEEEVILFGGGRNFSHCVNDWFSKLYVLKHFPDLSDLPILVSSSVIQPILELFELFDIPCNRIMMFKHEETLICKKVWLPSLTHAFQFFSPKYLQFFRDTIQKHAKLTPKKNRLYLGRQNALHRRVTNEAAIIELLEQYEFQTIIPEKLSIQEQIDLFTNAEMMVIPTGGGSASSIFAPEGAVIIDLSNPKIEAYQYYIAAAIQGLHFHQIIGNTEETNTGRLAIDCDFNIPIQELEKILKQYFGDRSILVSDSESVVSK